MPVEHSISPIEMSEEYPLSPIEKRIEPSHHSHYYFEDGVVIFLVEDTLFKVHRYFLTRHSEVFRAMFESPPTSDGPEGSSDKRPIMLPEVTAAEFELLLDFFYQGVNDLTDNKPRIEKWIHLLSIADRYVFTAVRAKAINHLESIHKYISSIERLRLAMRYNIDHWILPAIEDLCLKEDPLSFEEASIIGLKNFVLLAQAREIALKRRLTEPFDGWGEPVAAEVHDQWTKQLVRSLFDPIQVDSYKGVEFFEDSECYNPACMM